MHRPTRWLSFLLFVVCVWCPAVAEEKVATALPAAAPESVGVDAERLERIDTLLREHIERDQIAGGVALVARRGRVVWLSAAGHRDREQNAEMTEDTLFRIASMTKPITSVAVMMLVEEERLSLDDPVSKYLPEFHSPQVLVAATDEGELETVAARREITIHDLLTHTAGIIYGFMEPGPLSSVYNEAGIVNGPSRTELTLEENIRLLGPLPLKAQPGTAWVYGLSTDVLGRVVEVASEQPLDEFFRKRIFEPLQMRDTHFYLPGDKRSRLAALYTPNENGEIQQVEEEAERVGQLRLSPSVFYRGSQTYYSGGAGLVSTAGDYARFLQMLLNGGELDGVRLLQPETVDRMTSNQIDSLTIRFPVHGDKFGYGFGLFSAEAAEGSPASAGTYSWGGIFNTVFFVDPEREVIGVLMTQLYPFGHLSLWHDFHRTMSEAVEN